MNMATAENFVSYLMDQLADIEGLTFRKMFGEYALFKDGKVVALICDNQLFIKPTTAGRAFIGFPVEAPPYRGAKPSFLIGDSLDNREWLGQLILLTAAELPPPKKRKSLQEKTKRSGKK
jgi:TfoX/Sxy family transcriptional regulator of competence genes